MKFFLKNNLSFLICFTVLGFFASSTVLLPEALGAKKQNSAYLLYTKGVELSAKKKYGEAIDKFAKAISQNPSFVAAYIEYARALALQGKRGLALEKLEEGFKATSSTQDKAKLQQERVQLSELFYTNKTFQQYQDGLNFLRLDRAGVAVSSFEKALTVEPDNVAILLGYAQAIQMEEGLSAGVRPLERAFQINPEKKETRTMLGEALIQGEPEKAAGLLRPLAKQADASEQVSVLYARSLFEQQNELKQKEASDFLHERVDKNTTWSIAMFWLGKFYAKNPENYWLARKYLMMYLKREDEKKLLLSSDATAAVPARPNVLHEEAEKILSRVNKGLQ